MNRFTKDVGIVDEQLPLCSYDLNLVNISKILMTIDTFLIETLIFQIDCNTNNRFHNCGRVSQSLSDNSSDSYDYSDPHNSIHLYKNRKRFQKI